MAEARKQFSEISEELKYAEEMKQNAIDEREKFVERIGQLNTKIGKLSDEVKDKDITLEEYEAKMRLSNDELKIMKEANEVF